MMEMLGNTQAWSMRRNEAESWTVITGVEDNLATAGSMEMVAIHWPSWYVGSRDVPCLGVDQSIRLTWVELVTSRSWWSIPGSGSWDRCSG